MVSIGLSPGSSAAQRSFTDAPIGVEGQTEAEQLQARLDAGGTLTPVESGTLARLMDSANGSDVQARSDDGSDGAAPPDATSQSGGAGPAGGKTVGDFNVTNGNAQDVADLGQALTYLQSTNAAGVPLSPTAVALLNALPAGATINIVHNGADQYDPNTGIIDWDPRSGLTVTSGQGTQSPALGLVHEVDHEVNGQPHPIQTGDGYENSEEQRVIQGSETTIANDLHEPTRTDHGGQTVDLGSSTDHSYYDNGNVPPVSSDLPGLTGTPPDDGFGPSTDPGNQSGDPVADPSPPPVSSDLPGAGDDGGYSDGGFVDGGYGGGSSDGGFVDGSYGGGSSDGGFVDGGYGGGGGGSIDYDGGTALDQAELESA